MFQKFGIFPYLAQIFPYLAQIQSASKHVIIGLQIFSAFTSWMLRGLWRLFYHEIFKKHRRKKMGKFHPFAWKFRPFFNAT